MTNRKPRSRILELPLGFVEKYTIQPALPSSLSLNPFTGDIVGTVDVLLWNRFDR